MGNISNAKFGYEILGQSVAELAREHSISEEMLKYAIAEEGWTRVPLKDPMAEVTQLSDDVVQAVQDRCATLKSMKNAALTPQYIALETEILSKARELVSSLNPDNPLAAQQVKLLTEVLGNLRGQVGDNVSLNEKSKGDGSLTVRIMTSSRGNGREERSAIEVKTHAAKEIKSEAA